MADGSQLRTQFLVAATAVFSVPYFPDVPGRDDFRGPSHHTARWPAEDWWTGGFWCTGGR